MKILIFILWFIPFVALANANDSRVVGQNPGDFQNNTSTNPSDESTDLEDQSLGETGGFNVTQQGGLDGTNNAQNQGSGVQMLGLAMGAMFASQCGPHNPFACAAAALSFADAMAGSSANSAAYQTGTYMDPTAGGGGNGTGTDPIVDQQIQDGLQDLSDAGFTLNGDGSVTGPDGQTYTAADLQNAESLEAKGASPEQAAQFVKEMGQVQAAAAKKAGVELPKEGEGEGQAVAATSGFGSVDASGGGSGGAGGGDTLIEEIEYRNGKGKQKRGIAEAAASKLSTNFNGDPIGIGMGNLFLIVNQKYGSENQKKRFFDKENVMNEYMRKGK